MKIGSGTKDIRIRAAGACHVMCVAKFEEAICVLHCFQKKTKTTTKHDKNIAQTRYRAVLRERSGQK
jgi:phage-related protein